MISFPRGAFHLVSHRFDDIENFDVVEAREIVRSLAAVAERDSRRLGEQVNHVAIVLVDGLSHREELLTMTIQEALGDIALIGGSSSDNLAFRDTAIFDGGSFGLNPGGRLAFQMPAFDEAIRTIEIRRTREGWRIAEGAFAEVPEGAELDYRAMAESTRDYVRKSGFSRVLLGLSGGIDSALVAAIAADALGPSNVRCVMLPSRYTSPARGSSFAGACPPRSFPAIA